ncbi:MAG TPA: hypothetical protein VF808_18695 [Ktedonobacterales bacterium]
MWQRRRLLHVILAVATFVALIAVCAVASYQSGFVASLSYINYRNTSPPVSASAYGVTLALAHSRYLTVERILLTLTNHSQATVYAPITSGKSAASDRIVRPARDGTVEISRGDACLAISSDVRGASSWRSLGDECLAQQCPMGAAETPPLPGLLVIQPGETALFPIYDGETDSPLWDPGVYRFSALYTQTFFLAPNWWPHPVTVPHGVTLTLPAVTLNAGPQYLARSQPHRCPFAA